MRLKRTLPLILICILLTGCWDKIEIDRKIFISTIAIDPGVEADNKSDLKSINPNDPFQQRVQQKKLKITYAYPEATELGPGKSGTAKNNFITADASSMQDAVTQAAGKSSRSIEFGETRLVMLSSAILEKPELFKEILDYFARTPNLNKMMQIMVTEGKAEDFIKLNPPMEKNIEAYLSGLVEETKRNATILPVTLNEFLVLINQNGNAILPKISMEREKNEINLSGIGLIKNYSLKGYLTPVEVSDLELMRGKLRGGTRTVYVQGHPINFNIEDIERKIKLTSSKNKLQFNINIRMEGSLQEFYAEKEVFSKNKLNEIQKYFDKSTSTECEIIAKMLQQHFVVDPIGLREYVEKFEPKVWNTVKDRWEESYKTATINVNVDTKIRRIGITK